MPTTTLHTRLAPRSNGERISADSGGGPRTTLISTTDVRRNGERRLDVPEELIETLDNGIPANGGRGGVVSARTTTTTSGGPQVAPSAAGGGAATLQQLHRENVRRRAELNRATRAIAARDAEILRLGGKPLAVERSAAVVPVDGVAADSAATAAPTAQRQTAIGPLPRRETVAQRDVSVVPASEAPSPTMAARVGTTLTPRATPRPAGRTNGQQASAPAEVHSPITVAEAFGTDTEQRFALLELDLDR